jgi:hypothetical protein
MNKDSLINFIKTRKVGKLPTTPGKLRAVQKGENPIGILYHPPMTAVPFFNTGKYQTLNPQKLKGKSESDGIKNWINFLGDMGDISDITDPSLLKKQLTDKQKLITPVMNQGTCGSCFSCSTSTAINDVFVYNGLGFNPNISPLLVMACAPTGDFNNHCNGGNPTLLIDWIENNGAATNFCDSYEGNMDSNGNVIVPQCGCCNPSKNHNKYFIKNKIWAYSDISSHGFGNSPQGINPPDPSGVSKIKDHLLNNGTAVTGFLVFRNWMTGAGKNFSDTNGVYLDSESYGAPSKDTDSGPDCNNSIQDNNYCCIGGHAVCIVGWGIEKSVYRPSTGETLSDVPFWFVRNSWGPQALTQGFFKIAMADKKRNINFNSAYEVLQYYGNDNTGSPIVQGGVLLFEPAYITPFDAPSKLQCNPNALYDKEEPKDPKFPVKGVSPVPVVPSPLPIPPDPVPKNPETSSSGNNKIWIILFIIIAIILLYLYFNHKKK